MKNVLEIKRKHFLENFKRQFLSSNESSGAQCVIVDEEEYLVFPEELSSFVLKVMPNDQISLRVSDGEAEKFSLMDILDDNVELSDKDVLGEYSFIINKDDLEKWTAFDADLIAQVTEILDGGSVNENELKELIEDLSQSFSYGEVIAKLFALSYSEWEEMRSYASPNSYFVDENEDDYGEESEV